MAKHELKMPSKDKIIDKVNEKEIIEEIVKESFLLWLDNNGYNDFALKEMFNDKKRISANEQNRFNITLRKGKKETGVQIFEMIVYLDDFSPKIKKILSIVDEETTAIIKKELAKKYNIEIEKNNLRQIFE